MKGEYNLTKIFGEVTTEQFEKFNKTIFVDTPTTKEHFDKGILNVTTDIHGPVDSIKDPLSIVVEPKTTTIMPNPILNTTKILGPVDKDDLHTLDTKGVKTDPLSIVVEPKTTTLAQKPFLNTTTILGPVDSDDLPTLDPKDIKIDPLSIAVE